MFPSNEKPILEIPDQEEDELDFDDDEVWASCLLIIMQVEGCVRYFAYS